MHVITENNRPIKIWASVDSVEESAIQQLKNIASLPFVKHICAMPDVHTGKGATVGSVVATKGAIVPSMVGVDIGCGMSAVRTSFKRADFDERGLNRILNMILKAIPVGTAQRNEVVFNSATVALEERMVEFLFETPDLLDKMSMDWKKQIGTLGGGNHFIELSVDEEDFVWIVVHTGSRGVGKTIADYYIERAKELCKIWMVPLVDDDLAYLPECTKEFERYMKAIFWCQEYAKLNRRMIVEDIYKILNDEVGKFVIQEAVDCHHNYIDIENHFGENLLVTRKGAVRARSGDKGIIPGSMGAKSYIVNGRGSKDSLCSSSHGAGRKMSRAAARKTISVDAMEDSMVGVVHRKGERFLDEAPMAYKDIDEVMENQKDLVEIVHTLKQILNVKG